MKRSLLFLAIIALVAGSITTTLGQTPDRKSVKARENLQEAKKDVAKAKKEIAQAKKDSIAEYQSFKKRAEIKIQENEKRIAALKGKKMSTLNEKEKIAYRGKINELEMKNMTLRKRLADYRADERHAKWASFKSEFNHDIDELGKAIKDFTIKNKK